MLTGSNNKRHAALPALWKALALAVITAMFAMCFAGTVFAVDLDKANSLLLEVGDGFEEDDTIDSAEMVVDMFLVADAKALDGFDTYTLTAAGDFSELQGDIDKAQIKVEAEDVRDDNPDNRTQWEAIAQKATALVRDGKISAVRSGAVGKTIEEIGAGLYLVLTHSADKVIEDNKYDSYFFEDEEDGTLSTIALSDKYEYHFTPQLFAFPFKGDGSEETFNTADSEGPWNNDLKVVLKGSMEERFGSIRVTKKLTEKAEDATFVFEVKAVKKDKTVYSNVFTLNFFDEGTSNSFSVIKKIPVGSTVTVSEVYEGASYELVSVSPEGGTDVIKDAETIVEFEFVNKPVGGPGGTGVLNTFTNGDDGWTWNKNYNRDSSSDTNSAEK